MKGGSHKAYFVLGLALAALVAVGVFVFGTTLLFDLRSENTAGVGNRSEDAQSEDEPLREEEVVVIDPPDTPEEEAVIVDGSNGEMEESSGDLTVLGMSKPEFEYVIVTDSCGHDYGGDCVHLRAGPGTDFASVSRLRNGQVFKIGGAVERDGRTWYKLVFHQGEWLRYPERIQNDWYVAGGYVTQLRAEGPKEDGEMSVSEPTKRIVVDRSEQTLTAYENGEVFMKEPISTGLELTPTPEGTFTIFRKTPSRYMQGPIPGLTSKRWDLPGVPWVMYFTHAGAAIHGTYWHDNFGNRESAGCVNLPVAPAERLYRWADLGTRVVVQE